jgi:hypothetical protein
MCFYNLERPRCLHGGKCVYLGPCASEYRPGETCGAQTLHEIVELKEACKDCERLEKKGKKKKLEKEKMKTQERDSKIAKSGTRRGASIVKCEEMIEN